MAQTPRLKPTEASSPPLLGSSPIRHPGQPPANSKIDPSALPAGIIAGVKELLGTMFVDLPESAVEIQMANNRATTQVRLSVPVQEALRERKLMGPSDTAPTTEIIAAIHAAAADHLGG